MGISLRWLVKKTLRLCARSCRRRRFAVQRGRTARFAYWIAGGMGDGIMSLPALAFLKKEYPDARIDVFAPPATAGALAVLLSPFSVSPATFWNVALRAAVRLRWDASFTNTISVFRPGHELCARLTSRFCASFRYPDEQTIDRLCDATRAVSEEIHDVDQNLLLVEETLGVFAEPADRRYPAARAVSPPAAVGAISVLLHPGAGAGYSCKKWPDRRYADIISRLLARGHRVTVLCGPADAAAAAIFSKINGVELCRSGDVRSLLAALSQKHLFIGNDSGPSHCASLFGIRCVIIYGPTSAVRNLPRGNGDVAAVTGTAECAPCHFQREPCGSLACIESISVDRVWVAVERQIRAMSQ